jgi:hypothetical protein
MKLASDMPYPSLGSVSIPVPQGPNSVDQYVNGNQPYSPEGGPGSQALTNIALNLGGLGTMAIGGITEDPGAVDEGAQLLEGDVPLETTTPQNLDSQNQSSQQTEPVDVTPVNPKKVSTSYLNNNGIDPHDLKYDTLGNNAPISQYNIYVDKDGSLWLQKNGSNTFIPTYENINN